MAEWKTRIENAPQRLFDKLKTREPKVRSAYEKALEALEDKPLVCDNPSGTIKHLKGEYLCHHEYRSLPNEQRIFYKTLVRAETDAEAMKQGKTFAWDDDNQKGLIVIFYAGPHP